MSAMQGRPSDPYNVLVGAVRDDAISLLDFRHLSSLYVRHPHGPCVLVIPPGLSLKADALWPASHKAKLHIKLRMQDNQTSYDPPCWHTGTCIHWLMKACWPSLVDARIKARRRSVGNRASSNLSHHRAPASFDKNVRYVFASGVPSAGINWDMSGFSAGVIRYKLTACQGNLPLES